VCSFSLTKTKKAPPPNDCDASSGRRCHYG
jgi:hypothetical protein